MQAPRTKILNKIAQYSGLKIERRYDYVSLCLKHSKSSYILCFKQTVAMYSLSLIILLPPIIDCDKDVVAKLSPSSSASWAELSLTST